LRAIAVVAIFVPRHRAMLWSLAANWGECLAFRAASHKIQRTQTEPCLEMCPCLRCRAPPRRSTRMRSGPTRTPPPIRLVALMTGEPARLGLLDTNIMILRSRIAQKELPDEMAISAVTLAERSAGPHEVRPDTEQTSTSRLRSGLAG
jgi:hypothetical protein